MNKNLRTNINSRLAASKKKNWVRLVAAIVHGLNNTSFTDWRAPQTPVEIVKLSPKAQTAFAKKTYALKSKRNQKLPGAKLAKLEVGSWVRIALEGKVKGVKMGAKGPKQKWSGKTYQISKVSKTGMYTLKGLAKRRFARYWLQPVPGQDDVAGGKIKAAGSTKYSGQAPRPEPQGAVKVGLKKMAQGTAKNPFPSRAAAKKAGWKSGDKVFWKSRGGQLRKTL